MTDSVTSQNMTFRPESTRIIDRHRLNLYLRWTRLGYKADNTKSKIYLRILQWQNYA